MGTIGDTSWAARVPDSQPRLFTMKSGIMSVSLAVRTKSEGKAYGRAVRMST